MLLAAGAPVDEVVAYGERRMRSALTSLPDGSWSFTDVLDSADAARVTVRLTVAQALVRFLASQYTERDGVRQRLVEGCWGIFGHGNVAGVGQALLQAQQTGEADLTYYLARNEQAMVHASVGFARTRNRLQAMA